MKKKKPKERSRQGGSPSSRNQARGPITLAAVAIGAAASAETPTAVAPDAGQWFAYLIFPAILFLLILTINALLVASETAIEQLRPMHLKHFEKDSKAHVMLADLLEHKARYATGCVLGLQTTRAWTILLCSFPAFYLGARVSDPSLSGIHVFGLAVLISIPVAALHMAFGELIPKSYASIHPVRVSLRLYRFVKLFALTFAIPGRFLRSLATLVTQRFGAKASFVVHNQAEEEIKSIVETAEEQDIKEEEKELIHSVFEFSDTVVREVMTPRVDMDSVPITSDPEEIVKLIQESGHSRIPVYEETDDQIVGIIHAKDLLSARAKGDLPTNLRTILRPALFVPENKNLYDLLKELRVGRGQMAIVQDEFGGTAGLATIEDIVEELVGEIVDEYDVETPDIVSNGKGFYVEGRTNLYDLNEEIGSDFKSEEFDTVGGFVFGLFGRQPQRGEELDSDGYKFRIEETDGRRIIRLHVEKFPDGQPA